MSKVLIYLTVFVLIGQIVLAHENDLKTGEERRNEKLSVTVKIIEEDDETNGPRKTEVTVSFCESSTALSVIFQPKGKPNL